MKIAGAHLNGWGDTEKEVVRRLQGAVNLVLDPHAMTGVISQVAAQVPGTFIIARFWNDEGELVTRINQDPQAAAEHYYREAWGKILALPLNEQRLIGAIQVANEVMHTTGQYLAKLAEFDIAMMVKWASQGYRACINASSVGWPYLAEDDQERSLRAYIPALQAAQTYQGLLVFHQYGPFPLFGPVPSEVDHAFRTHLKGPYSPGHYITRWQSHVIPWYENHGVSIGEYVISETGYDGGVIPDYAWRDDAPKGWQAPKPWGYGGDVAAYANDLEKLMREYARDTRCRGALVYAVGSNGDSKWESFRSENVLLALADRGIPDRTPPTRWLAPGGAPAPQPPAVTPEPGPAPVPPSSASGEVKLPTWVTVTLARVAPGTKVWRLVKAEWHDETESGGRHHIYIEEPHNPNISAKIMNTQTLETWIIPLEKPRSEPAGNHPMYGIGNSYAVRIEGAESDMVKGLELPGNHHVTYHLWFQMVTEPQTETPVPVPPVPVPPAPVPPKPPTPTPVPAPAMTAPERAFSLVEKQVGVSPTHALPSVILGINRKASQEKAYHLLGPEVRFQQGSQKYVALGGINYSNGELIVALTTEGDWNPANILTYVRRAGKIRPFVPGVFDKPPHTWSPSPNFNPRPGAGRVDTIVLHHTGGGFAGSLSWLKNPNVKDPVSTHYLIDKDGSIYQLVADDKEAWHAGYSRMPDGRNNVGDFSLGYELVNAGNGRDPYPPAQIAAVKRLMTYHALTYPITRERVVTHKTVRKLWMEQYPAEAVRLGVSAKIDPAGLDVEKLVREVYDNLPVLG
jgi:hypothetical protein